jgi:hypothetical protein
MPFITLHGTHFQKLFIKGFLQFTNAAVAVIEPVKKHIQKYQRIFLKCNGLITDLSPFPLTGIIKKNEYPLNAKIYTYQDNSA